jgi:hypothetical protein
MVRNHVPEGGLQSEAMRSSLFRVHRRGALALAAAVLDGLSLCVNGWASVPQALRRARLPLLRCGLSDQVGNLHGAKYQFDPTYNVAHSLAAGEVRAQVVPASKDGDGGLPRWANFLPSTDRLEGTLTLSSSHPRASVRVVNHEMSWEPFFARLVGKDGAQSAAAVAATVVPSGGDLAPRG